MKESTADTLGITRAVLVNGKIKNMVQPLLRAKNTLE